MQQRPRAQEDDVRQDHAHVVGLRRVRGRQLDVLRPHRDEHARAVHARPRGDDGADRRLDGHAAAVDADDPSGQLRGQADEVQREWRRRTRVDGAGVGELLDAPGAHHRDAIGHHEGLVLIVRHEDGGDAQLAQEMAQLDLHLLA